MFCLSSTLCFAQGAPLRLCGRLRSVESSGCSKRPRHPMPLPGTNFKMCMLRTQHYHDTKEVEPLTIDDYHALIEAGRLHGRRVELLNGSLIKMHPQSPEHFSTVTNLDRIFFKALENENRAVVRQAAPITLMGTESEPEPDITIASGSRINYMYRHPVADDTLLLVEVSNSTLRKDSGEKLELYASENIPEYWVVDIERRSVRVLRSPEGKRYLHDETFHTGYVAPAAYPDVLVNVEKLFPYKVKP